MSEVKLYDYWELMKADLRRHYGVETDAEVIKIAAREFVENPPPLLRILRKRKPEDV